MKPCHLLPSLLLFASALSQVRAGEIIEEVPGANTVTAGSALGSSFLVNDAATGGGDHDSISFDREYGGASALFSERAEVTITGIAWASSASGTVASSATVTFTDPGSDQLYGTADDIQIGSVTDPLSFNGAGVYVWAFDTPLEFTASGAGFFINISSNGIIRRKTFGGTSGEANVKITIAGTVVGGVGPLSVNTASGSGDWDSIVWDRDSGTITGDLAETDTVVIGDDRSVFYNGLPSSERIAELRLGRDGDSQRLGQGRLDVGAGTLTVSGDVFVGLEASRNDSFLTVSGSGELVVGGNANFGRSARSTDGSLTLTGNGQLSVGGDLNMGAFQQGGSMLHVELPGSPPAVQVTGALNLDRCVLELSYGAGYVHTPGSQLTLATYGSRRGQFMNFREGDTFNSGPNRFRINYDVSGQSIVLTALPNFTVTDSTPPNIIYILTDDQGYADSPLNPFTVAGHGDKDWSTVFPMPRLESLASNGVLFTNGYVTGGVCHPSRAGIITGIYQQRIGAENNLPIDSMSGISPAARTVPRRLQSLGYRTYGVGKWHLGETVENHPNNRGFDRWYGMWLGSRGYYSVLGDSEEALRVFQNDMVPDYIAESQAEDNYLTDRIGDSAVAFIDEHLDQHAAQPFYMYLSFTSPHGPIDIKTTDERFDVLSSTYGLDESDYGGLTIGGDASRTQEKRHSLAAMCLAHDQNIGKVLDKLAAEGLLNNTIIVYQSDNGGTGSTNNYSINLPLSGAKGGNALEGSFRVPTVIQWPDAFPSGQVLDAPVTSLDIAATFVNAPGAPAQARNGLDGIDLFDYIQNGTPLPDDRVLTFRGGGTKSGGSAIRMGHYKLHINDATGVQTLYDFSDATPGVVDDQYTERQSNTIDDPELQAKLLKRFQAWEARVIAPIDLGNRAVPDEDLEYYPLVGGHRLRTESASPQFLSAVFRDPLPISADWSRSFLARATESGHPANGQMIFAFGDEPHPDTSSFNNPDRFTNTAAILASRSNLVQCIIDYETGQLTIFEGRGASSTSVSIPLVDLPREFTACRIEYSAASNELNFSVNGSRVTHALNASYSDFNYYATGVAAMEVEVTPLRRDDEAVVNLALLDEAGLQMDVHFANDLPFTLVGYRSGDLLSFSEDPDLLIESLGGGHYRVTGAREDAAAAFYRLKQAPRSGN